MACEMVLLAMLPENDGVMMVQTPSLRTISELESFIVDEYSRVFPHLPPLSQNLRIQKCVAPELVVDRRAHTTVRQQAPHVFVDLAKNVQTGNVFENMEQIYIVVNEPKKLTQPRIKKNATEVHNMLAKKSPFQISEVEAKEAHDSKEEVGEKKASRMTTVEKTQTTKKLLSNRSKKAVSKKTDVEDAFNSKDMKMVTERKNKVATKILPKAEKKVIEKQNYDASKVGAEEAHQTNGLKKNRDTKAISAAGDKTARKNVKGMRMAAHETSDSSKVISKEDLAATNASKKAISRKSENALLKKMLAAKHDVVSGAALIANNSLRSGGDVAMKLPSKSEKTRKSSDQDVSAAESTLDLQEPPAKKKKSSVEVRIMSTRAPMPIDEEQTEQKPVKKKRAVDPQMTAKPISSSDTVEESKKKGPKKSIKKTIDDSSTASETTPPTQKSRKKIDFGVGFVKETVAKRAVKEVLAGTDKALKKAKLAEKVSKKTKKTESGIASTPNNVSRSSSRSSSSSTQAGEPIFREETKVLESPVVKNAAVCSILHQKPQIETTSEAPKSRFQTILSDTRKRIAKEKEAQDKLQREITEAESTDDNVKQASKFTESTANESSSDSDAPPVVLKVTKHSPKVTSPVGSSSSSFSDADELDYSQSLLDDLIENETGDDTVAPVVFKKDKKSKKKDVSDGFTGEGMQEMEQSHDLHSSELTQKSHNSVLLPALSRNQFSLGSMPVAKLKKMSKNPFSSPKKATSKTGTATSRPRGRPRKVENV